MCQVSPDPEACCGLGQCCSVSISVGAENNLVSAVPRALLSMAPDTPVETWGVSDPSPEFGRLVTAGASQVRSSKEMQLLPGVFGNPKSEKSGSTV